jgi:prolyl-tRNA synthetase
MRQSLLFSKTKRESPKDEKFENAKLLIRAGFIDKLSAGIYNFLPLGTLVLKKIENIIREEMLAIGAQEILMPALHPKENWKITKRWDEMEEIFKLKAGEKEFALGPTHEEVITPLVKKFVKSYRDLPFYLFQIQDKFRNEKRVKSGLLRQREFLMKDLYSFHESKEDLDRYYEEVKKAYFRIFDRVEIGKKTHLTYASGGTFSKFSHEFQTECQAGEDTIFVCKNCNQAINKEIKRKLKNCPNCGEKYFEIKRAIEVANIFKLGEKFSRPFDLSFLDRDGKKKFVQMGCYGIGLGRLMGTVVEIFHDRKGIIWPKEISPFQVHLISIGKSKEIKEKAEMIYNQLIKEKISILYDDREKSPGEKFFDCDLIGIPLRMVISEKTLKRNCLEFKERKRGKIKLVKISRIKKFIQDFYAQQNL